MEILTKKYFLTDKNFNKLDLCDNCINNDKCSFKTDSNRVVSHCEEHSVWKEHVIKQTNKRDKDKILKTFSSLCQTCDHESNCSLKVERSNILECEQYE